MIWNVDLQSGDLDDRILMSREGIEADTPGEAIARATLGDVGHDWPIRGFVSHEPDGCRYWMATEGLPEEVEFAEVPRG